MAFNGGNLFVANSGTPIGDGTVSEVTPAGAVSTFASGFNTPVGLAFDSSGNLYVANLDNNTVSKVTPAGAVSTFATGFDVPDSLAFDAAGNLYVANLDNNTVSKVTPAGAVSTFATGFDEPDGLAFDSSGNLYVANGDSHNDTVSKVTPAGAVSTFASGFDEPDGLAFDSSGNLYVANGGNGTVSEVTPAGVSSTFATGFDEPQGLAFDSPATSTSPTSQRQQHGERGQRDRDRAVHARRHGGRGDRLQRRHGQSADLRDRADHPGHHRHAPPRPRPQPDADIHPGHAHGGAALGSPSVNTLTIAEPPAVQFSTGSETVNESAGTFSIPVTLAGSPTASITVPFTLGGTAVAGTDFSGVTASPLTFAIGQTTAGHHRQAPLRPRPQPDADLHPGHAPGGIALGSPSVNTLTITEPAAVQFSTGSETVNASAGTFSIPVTISGTPTVSTFASGFNGPVGLAVRRRRQPLRRQRQQRHGERGDARGSGQHVRLRVRRSRCPGLRRRRQPLRRQRRRQHGERGDARGDGQHLRLRARRSRGLAFDAAGNLYVANGANGTVSEVTPAGAVSTFASGFVAPVGLAFDAAGNLYVANGGNGTVSEVTPAGAVSTFASGFIAPAGLAFDAPATSTSPTATAR